MKKTALMALALVSTFALAGKPDWQNPNTKYDAKNNFTNKTTVTIRAVDDVNNACDKESKRLGNGGFGMGVAACSFWESKTCTIILPKKFTKEMLGHEMLHCIQGSFHD